MWRRIEFPACRSLHLPPTSSLGSSSLYSHCRPWFDALDPIRPPQGKNVRWTSKMEREGAREQISPRSPSSRRQTSLGPATPLIQALKSIKRVLTPDLIDVVGLAALINGNNDHSQARERRAGGWGGRKPKHRRLQQRWRESEKILPFINSRPWLH